MVRSKGNGKKVAASPYREYMELRSMSRRPPPPYTQVDSQSIMSILDDPTSKLQNAVQDSNQIRLGDEDVAAIIIKSGCVKYPTWRCAIYCIYGALMVLLCTVLISVLFPYPLHASCIVKWNINEPCTSTMQQFRSQILRWSPCVNCGPRGGRCLYTLQEPKQDESRVIRAVHLTPSVRTVEAIKIAFEDVNRTCVATGESVSKEWFRIFDYSTNYCNLHNLVTGIGFDKSPTFFELTVNAICTQYNMAVCD
ncbi:uncharacterized protein LOC143377094 [Andrena cerasifolii]|uniref:uncharacterized protein LOC143377094 n=1 Tax=Andrena cerasifolii TaxID=2819439 RepID=UPI0040383A8C